MRSINWPLILLVGMLSSCFSDSDLSIEFNTESLNLKTDESLGPNLFFSPKGQLYMSWIEIKNDTAYSLQYATLDNNIWSEPLEIVAGTDWFVNWADIPALVSYDDQYIAAHWLQMSGGGTYDYSVHITLSKDGGQTWSQPIIPHQQEVPAEHGFVSMAPLDATHFQIVWLDGRNTKTPLEDSNGHDHGGGQMSLRSAIMDFDGNISAENEIDNRVCDCCQTDMIIEEDKPIVIYRDRSASEVRDISISRYQIDHWTEPVKVHNDEWQIYGCPVNGPALAKNKDAIAVSWYTESDESPKVLIAVSKDGGKNFNNPYRLDSGGSNGRVDVVPWKSGFVASWAEKKDSVNYLMMSFIKNGLVLHTQEIMSLNASRRGGFPIIEPTDDGIVIAFTEVNKGKTVVQTKKMVFEGL